MPLPSPAVRHAAYLTDTAGFAMVARGVNARIVDRDCGAQNMPVRPAAQILRSPGEPAGVPARGSAGSAS